MTEYSQAPDRRRERALDNPTRRAILDLLIGGKGLGLSALSEKLAIPAANVSYHVEVLSTCGAVELVPNEKRPGERLVRLPQTPADRKKEWLDVSGSMRDDISAAQLKSLIETASQLRPDSAPGT
jgi:DNA-binding transcriptional ArsR family regulator